MRERAPAANCGKNVSSGSCVPRGHVLECRLRRARDASRSKPIRAAVLGRGKSVGSGDESVTGSAKLWSAVEAPLLKTIVVGYDDPTSATLERAAALAELTGAELIVTNAVPPVKNEPAGDATRTAGRRLEQARRALAERPLPAEFVPSVGAPAEAILRLAEERGADLIVVGTRKKGFFERLVEGSVNHEVLRRAKCDVLVVY